MSAEHVRLDEGRPGSDEGIVDPVTGSEIAPQKDLDELRDELAEIGVQRVNVLCPLDLRQLRL